MISSCSALGAAVVAQRGRRFEREAGRRLHLRERDTRVQRAHADRVVGAAEVHDAQVRDDEAQVDVRVALAPAGQRAGL